MNIAITYYKDIPLKEEEYERLLGSTVIKQFESYDIEQITFVKFDKEDYFNFLDGKKDTKDLRAAWAAIKINPSLQMINKNQKEKICIVCGKVFLGTGKSKFCHNRCKQANKNAKANP